MSTPNTSRHHWLAAGALASIVVLVACQTAAQGASAPAPAPAVEVGAVSQATFMNASLVNPASASLQADDDWTAPGEEDESMSENEAPAAVEAPTPAPAAVQPVDPSSLNQVLDVASIQNAMNQLSQMGAAMNALPTPDPAATPSNSGNIPFSIVLTPGGSPVMAVPQATYTPAPATPQPR